MTEAAFNYTNRSERPPGRLVTVASRVVPGVARVQADVVPFALAWEQANRRELERTGPLWVALGDSLSQSIGAGSYDRGWVGQLRERLRAAGRDYRLVNLSVSGARTEDVLERQLPAMQALAALSAAGRTPDFVSLMIGSNDIMSRAHRDGLARRFADILRALPPGSVVTTLPNPNAVATEANAIIEAAAGPRRLVVADLRTPRTQSWRGKLAADHFHPNEVGYAALTDVLADALGV